MLLAWLRGPNALSGRIVAFGEMMLRLSPSGRELLLQTPKLDVWIASAEANVACALPQPSHDVRMVSALPDNPLGDMALRTLRGLGVDVAAIRRAAGRMGLYSSRPASVCDRPRSITTQDIKLKY